jgi:RNA recognition motif-containing protein
VSNLPDETTKEEIKQIFMKFGKITQIFLPENPLTAKKEFEN